MKSLDPEMIRALTPILLTTAGAAIGIVALVSSGDNDTKLTSAMGLAGTAIAGASGLAQSTKGEPNSDTDTQNYSK